MNRPRIELQQNIYNKDNLGMIVPKQANEEAGALFTLHLCEHKTFGAYNSNYVFPLYRYESILGKPEQKISNFYQVPYSNFKNIVSNLSPEALFDYIYAVLHSPEYRKRYAEFLKSDFPRIPYPKDKKVFHELAAHGANLRELHLMESPVLDTLITTYPVDGSHEVKKPRFEKQDKTGTGKVWINETQYFGNVPEITWNFYIGGYQPAQKWLKDRKGRNLTIDDLRHWQRIIVALIETDKIMKEIDKIKFLPK